MSSDKSSSTVTQKRIARALVFANRNHRQLVPEFRGVNFSNDSLTSRNVASLIAGCCNITTVCNVPGALNAESIVANITAYNGSGPYQVTYELSWDAVPGA